VWSLCCVLMVWLRFVLSLLMSVLYCGCLLFRSIYCLVILMKRYWCWLMSCRLRGMMMLFCCLFVFFDVRDCSVY